MMRWFLHAITLAYLSSGISAGRSPQPPKRSVTLGKYSVDTDITPLELHIDVDNVVARNETAP